jgi:hypothetical protein
MDTEVIVLLNLVGTQVTDAGLVHLKGMNQFRTLILNGTEVTDVGLAHPAAPTSPLWAFTSPRTR